jgi:hypothetical protein
VPWDGYLKYLIALSPSVCVSQLFFPLRHVRPSEKFVQVRQKAFARRLVLRGSSNNLAAMAGAHSEEEEVKEHGDSSRKVAFGPITNAPNVRSRSFSLFFWNY